MEGHSAMIIVDKNTVYNLSMPTSFKFRSENISLNARLPLVDISGVVIFDKLDVHEALYVPLVGIIQQKAKVEGRVKLYTAYISDPIIIFSMFKADGKILNLEQTRKTIPWSEVLSSPYNLIFNVVLFSSTISYYAFRKRTKVRKGKMRGKVY